MRYKLLPDKMEGITSRQQLQKNQVELPASTSQFQDYTNIDITALVQEMINEPSTNYGFMIKLNNENYYRSMLFATSDYSNAAKHPHPL